MLRKLKAYFDKRAAAPAHLPAEPADPDDPDDDLKSLTDPPDVLLISVIGMDPAARDRMLDWMVEDCAAKGKTPVFITDDLDLSPWIERQLLIEHLPSIERQASLAPDLDWDLYLNRRLSQLKRKWRAAGIADLGQKLDQISRLGPSGAKNPPTSPAAAPIERQG